MLNAPVAVLGDTTICIGGAVQLFGPEAAAHSWQPATVVNDAFIVDPIANPLSSQWIIVTASNACGTIRDSAFVQVIDPQAFSGLPEFREQMDWVATACVENPPVPGVERVRLPGQHGIARAGENWVIDTAGAM